MLGFSIFAQTAQEVSKKKLTPEEAKEMILKHTGGQIRMPFEGASIRLLNTQEAVDASWLTPVLKEITNVLGIPFSVVALKSSNPLKDAAKALKEENVGAVMVIIADKNQPTILLAPENKWVQLNLSSLVSDGNEATQKIRIKKEIWRSFAYLMGAANSNSEMCAMQPVFSVQDLDLLKVQVVSPEPFNNIMTQASKLNIKPARKTTYRQAVIEGWAPEPTNKYQENIWKELKK
jgi:hypothetical protein